MPKLVAASFRSPEHLQNPLREAQAMVAAVTGSP